MRSTLSAASTGIAIAIIATPILATNAPIHVTFSCSDDLSLSVVFHGGFATVTEGKGKPVTLAQQVSGSGFRYGDGRHELMGKGREITWIAGKRAPLACRERASP